MRVLIVEDDKLLGDALQQGLRAEGFAADWVSDGKLAEQALGVESFQAMVLDLGLPRLDGRALLRRLRQHGTAVPVLILTARDALEERVAALDEGADDYLVKPAALNEIAARLRALVRRANGAADAVIRVGKLSIDTKARSVSWQDRNIELGPREYALLLDLAQQPGQVLSREQLQQHLYDWDHTLESNAIEVHIHHLRRKIDADLIRTIRGVGYVMPRAAQP
jgi:DNA-binding response OmpR family regulator